MNKNNNEVLNYLKPNFNNTLSSMKGFDLLDILILINKYFLKMREYINVDKNDTFGIEIEVENAMKNLIIDAIEGEFTKWDTYHDGSLSNGIEIKSPVLKDTMLNWQELKKVCEILKRNSKIGENCGGHIHIGAHIFQCNYEFIIRFMKIWSAYENILFRFLYGSYLTQRPNIKKYARPVQEELYKAIREKKTTPNEKASNIIKYIETASLINLVTGDRYKAVNFDNIVISRKYYEFGNTIEFRSPNGTIDPVIWQNNINAIIKLIEYCKSNRYDEDIINKRHNEVSYINEDITLYNEIFIEQALELCDMIFANNLDKIYFLRQYLKNFEIGDKPLAKAKIFTK